MSQWSTLRVVTGFAFGFLKDICATWDITISVLMATCHADQSSDVCVIVLAFFRAFREGEEEEEEENTTTRPALH